MIRVRLLGGAAVTANGETLTGGVAHRHRLALLALLSRAPARSLSREKIAVLLWPDADGASSRNLLRVALHHLRRELGRDALISEGSEIRLNTAVVNLDVIEFEEACQRGDHEQAAAVYVGPFLDGFHLQGAPEYDQWLDNERSTIQRHASKTFSSLAEATAHAGDARGAVSWWRRAAAIDPYDSAVAVKLMRALLAAGDPAGAVKHGRIHKALLLDELGVPAPVSVLAIEAELSKALKSPVAAGIEPPALFAPYSNPTSASGEPALVSPGAARSAVDERAVIPPVTQKPGFWPPSVRAHGRRLVAGSLLLASAAVIVITAGRLLLTNTSDVAPGETGTSAGALEDLRQNRVLVLPLDAPDEDAKLRLVGRMAADWVTRGLQRSGIVEVIDPSTAYRLFTDADPAGARLELPQLRQLAEGSHAGIIVWGAVYRQGDDLELRTQVIDARDGKVLRTLDPVSADPQGIGPALEILRTRVSGALATIVDGRLATLVSPSSSPPTFEAYQEFALGLDVFSSPWDQSYQHFERARQLDSSFTLASFWVAHALFNGARFELHRKLVKDLTRQRDNLAPVDQAGLDMFVAQQQGDWEAAYAAAHRAAQLAPQSNWAYMAALNALRLGRPREALRELESLNPESGWVKGFMLYWSLRMHALHQLGEYEEQLSVARIGRQFVPAGSYAQRFGVDRNELIALAALGRKNELEQRAESLIATALAGDSSMAIELHWVTGAELRAHGDPDGARKHFERCVALNTNPRCLYELGRYEELVSRFGDDELVFDVVSAAAAHLGRRADVDRLQAIDRARPPGEPAYQYSRSFADARVAMLLGDRARALAILQSEPQRGRLWDLLHWSGDFESLRGDPSVTGLLQPGGRPGAVRRR